MPAGAELERQAVLRPLDLPARLGEDGAVGSQPAHTRPLPGAAAGAGEGREWYGETNGQMVLFFVPEHTLPFETIRGRPDAPELWAEVTTPHRGPPRPIRLAIKKEGKWKDGVLRPDYLTNNVI